MKLKITGLLLLGFALVATTSFAAKNDDTYVVAKFGQQVQSSGLPIFKETLASEYAKKYPFFKDSVEYLERHLSPEELASYQFVYTTADEVEIRYTKKPIFRVRNVSAKFSRFVLNDYKIQLRKYQTFKQYLSVVHQIFYTPPASPAPKKVRPKKGKKLPSTKENASYLEFLMPKAFAVGQREAVLGTVLFTAVLGYAEVVNDSALQIVAQCTESAKKLETDFKRVLGSCIQKKEPEAGVVDENASNSLRSLVANYEFAQEEFSSYVMNSVDQESVDKAVAVFNRMPTFYMKFKFADKSAITDEASCSQQLLTGYSHLEIPGGENAMEKVQSAFESTIGKKQYGSRTSFWLAMSKNLKEVSPCVKGIVGDAPVKKPEEEAEPNMAATDGPPPTNILPPEVVTYSGDKAPLGTNKENMRPRKVDNLRNQDLFAEPMQRTQQQSIADDLRRAVPKKPLKPLNRPKEPVKKAEDKKMVEDKNKAIKDPNKKFPDTSKKPANAMEDTKPPSALKGIPDPNK